MGSCRACTLFKLEYEILKVLMSRSNSEYKILKWASTKKTRAQFYVEHNGLNAFVTICLTIKAIVLLMQVIEKTNVLSLKLLTAVLVHAASMPALELTSSPAVQERKDMAVFMLSRTPMS